MHEQMTRVKRQVELWGTTPAGPREDFEIMLMRAIMQLSACCADQKRVIDGGNPIRPLHTYPDPLAYFAD